MSTITKVNNAIIVQPDNSDRPATFAYPVNVICTYGTDTIEGTEYEYVMISFDNRNGYKFGAEFINPNGPLTSVNGVDVSAFTAAEIVTLINNGVLTNDAFSGTPVFIDDTNTHTGNFTGFLTLEDTVLSSNTVIVDSAGDPISSPSIIGVTIPAFTPIYGHFTAIDLTSGNVQAYSNL